MSSTASSESQFISFIEDYVNSDEEKVYEKVIDVMAGEHSNVFSVSCSDIYNHNPDLGVYMIDNPDYNLGILSQVVRMKLRLKNPVYVESIKSVEVELHSLPNKNSIYGLNKEHIGKLVEVKGLMILRTEKTARPVILHYVCPSCGTVIPVEQTEQWRISPDKCTLCDVRKGFKKDYVKTEYDDYQWIEIQETVEDTRNGKSASKVKVLLRNHRVDSCLPGETITVTGIYKTTEKSPNTLILEMDTYIDAVTVINDTEDASILLTKEDIAKIRQYMTDPEYLTKIIHSIAPSLYGLEHVKEALAYQMCEGQVRVFEGMRRRGQFHILLAGNPGCGKSELGEFMILCHPKGSKIIGKGSTGVGITAAVVKEGERYVLKAGAMPLADNGFLFVDEIEKMDVKDSGMMHPGMAQQKIKINKADISAELNTRCVIGNSKILCDDGVIRTIKDLVENKINVNVFSLTKNMKLNRYPISQFHDLGVKETIKITTNSGRNIEITGNSKLPTLSSTGIIEWKNAFDLTKEDYIVAPKKIMMNEKDKTMDFLSYEKYRVMDRALTRKILNQAIRELGSYHLVSEHTQIPKQTLYQYMSKKGLTPPIYNLKRLVESTSLLWENVKNDITTLSCGIGAPKAFKFPQKITKEFSYLLGLLFSDGNIGSKRIQLSNTEQNVLNAFENISHGFSLNTWRDEVNVVTSGVTFKNICEDVLDRLLCLNEETLKAWLHGVLDGDGSISVKKKAIVICTAKRDDAEKVIYVLSRLGIIGRLLYTKPKKVTIFGDKTINAKEQWNVGVNGVIQIKKLFSGFNMMHHMKRRKLVEEICLMESTFYQGDIIPIPDKINNIKNKHLIKKQENSRIYNDLSIWSNKLRRPSRQKLDRLRLLLNKKGFEDTILNDLISSDVFFDKIIKIEEAGKQRVYDLTIPSSENFVVNNLIMHNCSILAACNPVGGFWNEYKTTRDNLHEANKGLPLTLLDRFALTFVFKQNRDSGDERKVVQHIMRVSSRPETFSTPYSIDQLRKIFSYARTITVKTTEEVTKILEDFCMVLFDASLLDDSLMITRRQPHDLIRLAEASARLHGRSETTVEDADNAKRIVAESLQESGIDPDTGKLDQSRALYGKTQSASAKLKSVPVIVERLMKKGVDTTMVSRVVFIEYTCDLWMVAEAEAGKFLENAIKDGSVHCPTPSTLAVTT